MASRRRGLLRRILRGLLLAVVAWAAVTIAAVAAFRSQPRVTFLIRITGVHDHLED